MRGVKAKGWAAFLLGFTLILPMVSLPFCFTIILAIISLPAWLYIYVHYSGEYMHLPGSSNIYNVRGKSACLAVNLY